LASPKLATLTTAAANEPNIAKTVQAHRPKTADVRCLTIQVPGQAIAD
jgi:hypothetical protein